METFCSCCKLRLNGADDCAVYEHWKSKRQQHDRSTCNFTCTACLGLLHVDLISDALKALTTLFWADNYDVADFTLNVGIPVSLLVREVVAKFASADFEMTTNPHLFFSRGRVASVRECLREILGCELASVLGVPYRPRSEFAFQLFFTHPLEEMDCDVLTSYFPKRFGPKKSFREPRNRRKRHRKRAQDNCSLANDSGINGGTNVGNNNSEGSPNMSILSGEMDECLNGTEEVPNAMEGSVSADVDNLEADAELPEVVETTVKKPEHLQNKRIVAPRFNRTNVELSLSEISQSTELISSFVNENELGKLVSCDSAQTLQRVSFTIEILREPLFLAARYNKHSRYLSQTAWVIEGERHGIGSVEELIGGPLKEFTKADSFKFTASGREDVDVRCLGSGRPFVVQLFGVRRKRFGDAELRQIEASINARSRDVLIRQLQPVNDTQFKVIGCLKNAHLRLDTLPSSVSVRASINYVSQEGELKDGEELKSKSYSALCVACQPISIELLRDRLTTKLPLEISQKTPIRVLHRRPLLTRKRIIHSMRPYLVGENRFILDLTTSAGTYIKEFVHGDFGRTQPNIASLLGLEFVDILELDVESVHLDWPPNE